MLALSMLIAHTLSFQPIKIDNTSIILLLVILLSPFISAITKIKIGDFEAEIDPKEVKRIREEVSAQIKEPERDAPKQILEVENTTKSIRTLADTDPILALAKLRIELEKALNKLYRITHKDNRDKRFKTAGQLVHILSNTEILPAEIARSTREVISICNRAIHGEDIQQGDAESVVEAGSSLLYQLSFYVTEYLLKPFESTTIDKATLDEFWNSRYKVIAVVPLVDSPVKNTYNFDQEELDEYLEGYSEYAEFIVEMKKLDSTEEV